MWHGKPKKIITDEILRNTLMKYVEGRTIKTNPHNCWFFGGIRRNHYPRIEVNGRSCTAHRVVFELYFGEVPKDKPYVIHSCDEKSCVNPNHLRCGTMKDNAIDRRFGSKPLILTERDEKVVKFMRSLNYTYKEIAKKFDCSIAKVRLVCLEKHGHKILPEDYNPRLVGFNQITH